MLYSIILKWLVAQKFDFIVGFPPSVQDFFYMQHVPLNAKVSGYLDLKFHNVGWFKISKIYRKYAKGEKLWNFKYVKYDYSNLQPYRGGWGHHYIFVKPVFLGGGGAPGTVLWSGCWSWSAGGRGGIASSPGHTQSTGQHTSSLNIKCTVYLQRDVRTPFEKRTVYSVPVN